MYFLVTSSVLRFVFFSECGETGDSKKPKCKSKPAGPLPHRGKMKIKESPRLVWSLHDYGEASLLAQPSVRVETSSLLCFPVPPFLAERLDCGHGGGGCPEMALPWRWGEGDEHRGGWNDVPPRCPHPQPQILRLCYRMWRKGLCTCDEGS